MTSTPRILYDNRCPKCAGHVTVQSLDGNVGFAHSTPLCGWFSSEPLGGDILVELLYAATSGLEPVVDPAAVVAETLARIGVRT